MGAARRRLRIANHVEALDPDFFAPGRDVA
jgi:hypothetical protein